MRSITITLKSGETLTLTNHFQVGNCVAGELPTGAVVWYSFRNIKTFTEQAN